MASERQLPTPSRAGRRPPGKHNPSARGFPSDPAEEAHRRQQRALDVRFVVAGERLTQTVQCGWIRPLLEKQPYSPNCLVVGNSQKYA